jgi:hypothetical protein
MRYRIRIARAAGHALRALALAAAGAVVWSAVAGIVCQGPGVSCGGAAQAASFGEVVVLKGRVIVTRSGAPFFVPGRAAVEEGDRVDTLAGAKAQLVIGAKEGGMQAILAARTTVTVGALKAGSGAASPLSLVYGTLRARVRAWSGPPFVATRAAVIGIKGTDFVTWVKRPKAAEFVGVEGLIECVSRSNASYSIRIGPRQWGEIVENEQPRAPVSVPDDVWEEVQRELSFPEN